MLAHLDLRHIILHRLIAAEGLNRTPYFSADALRASRAVCPKRRPEPFQAKQLTLSVHRFGHAIGIGHQRIAGGERDLPVREC